MSQKKISIAIDGLVSAGKGATAIAVAKNLGYTYLDTGASYRAITQYCIDQGIDAKDTATVVAALPDIHVEMHAKEDDTHVYVNEKDVTSQLRSMEVNAAVAIIAKIPEVRVKLRKIQRKIASEGGYVLDGRDIGTHIIPDAALKVFMIGDVEVRAKRRQRQLLEKHGDQVDLQEIIANVKQRDDSDYFGENATSQRADDSRELDTTQLTLQDQIDIITGRAKELINEKN